MKRKQSKKSPKLQKSPFMLFTILENLPSANTIFPRKFIPFETEYYECPYELRNKR